MPPSALQNRGILLHITAGKVAGTIRVLRRSVLYLQLMWSQNTCRSAAADKNKQPPMHEPQPLVQHGREIQFRAPRDALRSKNVTTPRQKLRPKFPSELLKSRRKANLSGQVDLPCNSVDRHHGILPTREDVTGGKKNVNRRSRKSTFIGVSTWACKCSMFTSELNSSANFRRYPENAGDIALLMKLSPVSHLTAPRGVAPVQPSEQLLRLHAPLKASRQELRLSEKKPPEKNVLHRALRHQPTVTPRDPSRVSTLQQEGRGEVGGAKCGQWRR